MTVSVWWAKVLRFLSGRDGIERKIGDHELQPIELPDIEPIDRAYASADGRTGEKEHLERKRREHEREIARLRAIAQSRARQ